MVRWFVRMLGDRPTHLFRVTAPATIGDGDEVTVESLRADGTWRPASAGFLGEDNLGTDEIDEAEAGRVQAALVG